MAMLHIPTYSVSEARSSMQKLMFEIIEEDKLNGFETFWKLFPRDKMRGNRKAGKEICRQLWKIKKLYRQPNRVMAAIKQDIKDIDKGVHAFCDGSRDRMCFFPGIQPWLNQDKWDRDIEPEVPKPPPKPPAPVQTPMTDAQKAKMLPAWRAIAQRRASVWPRN